MARTARPRGSGHRGGVAALHAVFFTFLKSGDHVVVADVVYEATHRLVATFVEFPVTSTACQERGSAVISLQDEELAARPAVRCSR